MHIFPRNMCTKFHLKLLELFLIYEVRFKFCDDTDKTFNLRKNRLAKLKSVLQRFQMLTSAGGEGFSSYVIC